MADQEYQVVLERLVELGKLDKAQKTQAIHVCQSWRKLEEFLEKSCQIDPWFLAKIRAENSGWMFAEWRANVERIALMRQLSKVSVQSYCCVPLEVKQDTLAVGFSEQPTPEMRNVLKSAFTNCSKLKLYCVPYSFIDQSLEELPVDDGSVQEKLEILERWADGELSNNSSATQLVLDKVFYDAYSRRASDIHFVLEASQLCVYFRIDGVLKRYRQLNIKYWGYLSARIKVLAGMNTAEFRRPQSGRFTEKIKGKEIDVRVASHPTTKGEALVLRLLDKHKMVVSIDALGFCEHSLDMLQRIYTQPQGLVLLTGPTGAGKTTTLYSILNRLNQGRTNIMTLEDPVEYELDGIRQTSIQKNVISFQEGIRAILRQDPDVILIGEIRDEETAKMAFRASQTGHLVLSTLHTNNVWGVFPRLLDFGISFESVKQTIVGVVAQRLVRKRCDGHVSPSCPKCNGEGVYGRTVIAEILEATPELKPHITQQDLGMLPKSIQEASYISLQSSAQAALDRDLTCIEEVRQYGVMK